MNDKERNFLTGERVIGPVQKIYPGFEFGITE
jgi:hypothetical protein